MYNHERPHEALKLRRPATVYIASPRRYPRPLVKVRYDPFSQVTRIDKHGFIQWHQRDVFISSALKHEYIELEAHQDDDRWNVRWGAIPLGRLDEHCLDRGLIAMRRPRGPKRVTSMSLL